jgi:hypothetical protein
LWIISSQLIGISGCNEASNSAATSKRCLELCTCLDIKFGSKSLSVCIRRLRVSRIRSDLSNQCTPFLAAQWMIVVCAICNLIYEVEDLSFQRRLAQFMSYVITKLRVSVHYSTKYDIGSDECTLSKLVSDAVFTPFLALTRQ